jgi:hypothetical protein
MDTADLQFLATPVWLSLNSPDKQFGCKICTAGCYVERHCYDACKMGIYKYAAATRSGWP